MTNPRRVHSNILRKFRRLRRHDDDKADNTATTDDDVCVWCTATFSRFCGQSLANCSGVELTIAFAADSSSHLHGNYFSAQCGRPIGSTTRRVRKCASVRVGVFVCACVRITFRHPNDARRARTPNKHTPDATLIQHACAQSGGNSATFVRRACRVCMNSI